MRTVTILVREIEAGPKNADGGRTITITGLTHSDAIGRVVMTFVAAADLDRLRGAIDSD